MLTRRLKGYGAVVYLRTVQPDGSFHVSMVMSKARVAPLKRQTVPRLELMACLMAAQLVELVRKALRLPESTPCTCWSDSMIALGWLRGDPRRWKQYVADRVRQIQSLTPVTCWRHCGTSDNPADLLTRGMMAEDLFESRQWLSGPDWLSQADPPSSDAGELTCAVSDAQDELFSAGELAAPSGEIDESSDCGVALCTPSNGGELESPSSDDVAEAVASRSGAAGRLSSVVS